MSARTYNGIANVAVLAAIASAFAFDHAGSSRWAFGALALVCGGASVFAYFTNQWRSRKGAEVDGLQHKQFETTSARVATRDVSKTFAAAALENGVLSSGWHSPAVSVRHLELHPWPIASANGHNWWKAKATYLKVWRVEQERRSTFADEVIQIVDGLCSVRADESFEFVIAPDGTFTIHHAGSKLPKPQTEIASLAVPNFEITAGSKAN
jgi:hypothetical protein